MHPDIYTFEHSNGYVVSFGAGCHLRVWRNIPGAAHELLTAHSSRCFHSPGPGDVFREGDLAIALQGARVVEVISRAETLDEADRRTDRAMQIVGKPWNALFANCQDCLSWIVTGKASSFQRDSLIGAAFGIGILAFLPAVVDALTRPKRG